MKKLVLVALAIGLGLVACDKETVKPGAAPHPDLYVGDSVRYSLDSLPVAMPEQPADYSDYYKLVQVYANNTVVIDLTHVFDNGVSVTYRAFVRYKEGEVDDLKGWYRRRKVTGFVIPNHKEVAIYRTTPYDIPKNLDDSDDAAFPDAQ